MNRKQDRRYWLCSLAVLFTLLVACSNEKSEKQGDGNMLGLFGGKGKKTVTIVAPEVGDVLHAQTSVPEDLSPPVEPAFPQCELAHVIGNPIDGQWVSEEILGETERIYRMPGSAAHPPLAFFATGEKRRLMQLWELSEGDEPRFLKQRPIKLDADQDSWFNFIPLKVLCLPGGQVLLVIEFRAPHPKDALFIYNPADNQFSGFGLIEPVMSVLPFTFVETLFAAPEAVLVQYYTDSIRLGYEDYIFKYNHILLFSARYPKGFELLKLGIDDGNVHAWGMRDKTLWMKTHDKRKKPKDFIWSLDLSNVLSN